MVSSQPPLGPAQPPFNVQQMGGSNIPPNPFTNIGQIPQQQHQQPLNMGKYIPNVPYQQPSLGTCSVLPLPTCQGGNNYQTGLSQPGGTYAPRGNQNHSNIPLVGGFNPFQQGGYTMPYNSQVTMGGYAQYLNQMGPIPQYGMYPYANNPYLGMSYGGFGMNVNRYPFNQSTQNPFALTKLPFIATLQFLELSKLTNGPIQHHSA